MHPHDPTTKRCPFCVEEIFAAAVKCRYCLSMLPGNDSPNLCSSCQDGADASSQVTVHAGMDPIVTHDEVLRLLSTQEKFDPVGVEALVPRLLTVDQIRQVLQNLVDEQVPIKDFSTILNSLADHAKSSQDPFQLTEHVRITLGRKISQRYQINYGLIRAFILSPDAERTIQSSIQDVEGSQQLELDPNQCKALLENLTDALKRHRGEYSEPIIVVNGRIRRFVRELLKSTFADVVVLGYPEVVGGVQLENLETIELHEDQWMSGRTTWQAAEPAKVGKIQVRPGDDDADFMDDFMSVRW